MKLLKIVMFCMCVFSTRVYANPQLNFHEIKFDKDGIVKEGATKESVPWEHYHKKFGMCAEKISRMYMENPEMQLKKLEKLSVQFHKLKKYTKALGRQDFNSFTEIGTCHGTFTEEEIGMK